MSTWIGGCIGELEEETEDMFSHPSQMLLVRAIPPVAVSRLFHDAGGNSADCSYVRDLVVVYHVCMCARSK